jgi:hypothetical protein
MKLFTFSIMHPAAEDGPLTAIVPAASESAARKLLATEFFFNQDLVNGYMFDVKLVRSAELPLSMKRLNVITVQLPDGRMMEKAF